MGEMDVLAFQEAPGGAPRLPPEGGRDLRRPHEPMFNAPWPPVALAAVIVGGYAVQTLFAPGLPAAMFGFSREALDQGRAYTLLTSIFIHGGWAHAGLNAAFGLAFGAPVARFFGKRPAGVVGFFVFYLVGAMFASLGYALVHRATPFELVGASGAVSALMGAAARLIAGGGRIGPLLSRPVIAIGGSWVAVNLIFALFGSFFMPGMEGAAVAWEAHLFGLLAGLLLIKPTAWLAHRG